MSWHIRPESEPPPTFMLDARCAIHGTHWRSGCETCAAWSLYFARRGKSFPTTEGERQRAALTAFVSGDDRDEPLRCAKCGRDDVVEERRGWLLCACGTHTSMPLAVQERTERLAARIARGDV